MKVVIIGGVAGGASAAARLRRLDEHAEIILLERSGFVSYANCGLPYYIGGVITDERELTLQTPDRMWNRFRIRVRTKQEATQIDRKRKIVVIRDLETGRIYEETYDKLILSPGAQPAKPVFPGIDSERVFTLRTVEDTLRIRRFTEKSKPASAVLVGGGFISLEVAENLCHMGMHVTIIQRPGQLMNMLDFDMAAIIHAELRRKGIDLKLNTEVIGFTENAGRVTVQLKNDSPLTADMVLLAIGVRPETRLAKDAGLELGIKGSIVVNERMETSDPDIYAVGDAVQIRHMVTGLPAVISLAGPANKQGRIAANNICGGNSRYQGSPGSSVIKLFDLTAAYTGLSEKTAAGEGLDYDKVILSPASHATYYPGAKTMCMKVVFEKHSLRILGAQIIGYNGVDKRLDIIAAAIALKATADQLQDLDLAYAPPYSSAKDPVNMAGFIIDNITSGRVKQFHWNEVHSLPRDGSLYLLDTRSRTEYRQGHVDGFDNLPLDDLRKRIRELDKAKPVYVMCESGLRSYIACRILTQEGFDCFNFSGGYLFYQTVMLEKELLEKTSPCGTVRGTELIKSTS